MKYLLSLVTAGLLGTAVFLSPAPSRAQNTAHPRFAMGLVRNLHAHVSRTPSLSLASEPASADLRQWAPVPRQQGNYGSCASNDTTELLAWQDNRYLGGAPHDGYAVQFQFEQIVGPGGCGPNTGTSFDDNLTIEQHEGAVPADQYQTVAGTGYNEAMYDCLNPPTAADFQLAAHRTISSWQYIGTNYGGQNEVALRATIASGQPVLGGLDVYSNFEFAGTNGYPQVIGTPSGQLFGQHAILFLAYDATGPIFLNSWGGAWDMAGFGQMTWAAFDQIVFALVTVDPPAIAPTPLPTATRVPTATSTATPRPTSTSTSTPRPTATVRPTATSTPSPTRTVTPPHRRKAHRHLGRGRYTAWPV